MDRLYVARSWLIVAVSPLWGVGCSIRSESRDSSLSSSSSTSVASKTAKGGVHTGRDPNVKKPEWLRQRAPQGERFEEVKESLSRLNLNTVCQEAQCPNIGEQQSCFLGILAPVDVDFCAVKTSRNPAPPDPMEPENTAKAIASWGVPKKASKSQQGSNLTSCKPPTKYFSPIASTLTEGKTERSTNDMWVPPLCGLHRPHECVDRDDLPDGGSGHFAETVKAMKKLKPDIMVECLTSDFRGNLNAVAALVHSGLDVFAHNIETVKRLQRIVRDPRAGGQLGTDWVVPHSNVQILVTDTSFNRRHRFFRDVSSVFKGIVEARVEARRLKNALRRLNLCTTLERHTPCPLGIRPRHAFCVVFLHFMYEQSLSVLKHAKHCKEGMTTKSSIMLGLGESDDEIKEAMVDLRAIDVDILTLGQYLQPTPLHLTVKEYVTPEKFASWKEYGESIGFRYVASGPLVRSSYRAIGSKFGNHNFPPARSSLNKWVFAS
ncbi:radical SAM superfamily protein [Actinidia rufa]|uniref:Radical SAM superfamily protein n=1 Tax=Actinidia rufa TaxID=165716 RepID=A0A7J0GXN8_9ERIC|nr:radical SAM superfamily protein [Actinidia rufa]